MLPVQEDALWTSQRSGNGQSNDDETAQWQLKPDWVSFGTALRARVRFQTGQQAPNGSAGCAQPT